MPPSDSPFPARAGLRASLVVLVSALGAGQAAAQIPDTFSNLQVMPKEIAKRDLVDTMREISGALGVRCNHCHVGEGDRSLEGFDFASDAKETKKVARAMMRMTREINERLLPAAGRPRPLEVRCVTCHRGVDRPRTLEETLVEIAAKDGVTAAIARYRELRDRHYGRGGYDFGPRSLGIVADRLANAGNDLDGAVAITLLNIEQNPSEAGLHLTLGDLHARRGDTASAEAAYGRCLQMDPKNQAARERLDRLRPQPAPR